MTVQEQLKEAFIAHQQGQLEQAQRIYQQILAEHPHQTDAMHYLGLSYVQKGDHEQGMVWLQQAILEDATQPHYHESMGQAYASQQQWDLAEVCFTKSLDLAPAQPKRWYKLAQLYQANQKLDSAITAYRQCVHYEPSYYPAWYNLALLYLELDTINHVAEIESCLQQFLALQPNHVGAYQNLGNLYRLQGRYPEALEAYLRILKQEPQHGPTQNNLGNVWLALRELTKARECYQQAQQQPESEAEATYNLASLGLLEGDWSQYATFERLRFVTGLKGSLPRPLPPEKLWQGESLAGKFLLLQAEQGFGDTLQFIRYAAGLKAQGAQLMLCCQQPLLPLLKELPEITHVFGYQEPLPPYDYYIPLMSLPERCGIAQGFIPTEIPYITVPSQTASPPLETQNNIKVGLVWRSGFTRQLTLYYELYQKKSVPLEQLQTLMSLSGIYWYGLQVDTTPEEQALLKQNAQQYTDLSPQLNDFRDTAGLVQQMDLILTVDTAMAHLAGAMGKPVWTMLPFNADWRWQHQRSDSPWYPTMTLFRQTQPGDWNSVIACVQQSIQILVQEGTKRNG